MAFARAFGGTVLQLGDQCRRVGGCAAAGPELRASSGRCDRRSLDRPSIGSLRRFGLDRPEGTCK
jgi:hypothetical protein